MKKLNYYELSKEEQEEFKKVVYGETNEYKGEELGVTEIDTKYNVYIDNCGKSNMYSKENWWTVEPTAIANFEFDTFTIEGVKIECNSVRAQNFRKSWDEDAVMKAYNDGHIEVDITFAEVL